LTKYKQAFKKPHLQMSSKRGNIIAKNKAMFIFKILFSQKNLIHSFLDGSNPIVEGKLTIANTDKHRIKIVKQFFVTQLKDLQTDKLIVEAVKYNEIKHSQERKGIFAPPELFWETC
jgi:hypothetical protein